MPDAVYRRVFDRMYNRLRQRLVAMAADPDDEARQQFEEWIAGLPDRLETSPDLRERGERLKRDVLGSAGWPGLVLITWQKAKEGCVSRPATWSRAAPPWPGHWSRPGGGSGRTAAFRRAFDGMIEAGQGTRRSVRRRARRAGDRTIERWDAAEISSQLELLLGRDLQYIRINGTVVGAGVGLALHAIVAALS